MTGLDIEPAPDINNRNASYCMSCSKKHARNETGLWIRHAKICPGLHAAQKQNFAPALSKEAQHLRMIVIAGGDSHRNLNPNQPTPTPTITNRNHK
jgi:hypothetical protein